MPFSRVPISRAGILVSWHRPLSFERTVIFTADCSSLFMQITGGDTRGFCWAFSDSRDQSLVPHSLYCLLPFILLLETFSVSLCPCPCHSLSLSLPSSLPTLIPVAAPSYPLYSCLFNLLQFALFLLTKLRLFVWYWS